MLYKYTAASNNTVVDYRFPGQHKCYEQLVCLFPTVTLIEKNKLNC